MALRFKVGQRVVCRFGKGEWMQGTVVKHWWCSCGCRGNDKCRYRKPYQIELDDGTLICAPSDTNEYIQEPISPSKPALIETKPITSRDEKLKKYAAYLRNKENVDEKSIAEFMSGLRFKVGDRVQCRMSDWSENIWEHGFVIEQLYEEGNDVYPYSILLDCGSRIYAPIDSEEIIKLSEVTPPDGLFVEDGDPLFKNPSPQDAECAICLTRKFLSSIFII